MLTSLKDVLADDDEKAMLVIGAAVALHGILAGGGEPTSQGAIEAAFNASELFWAEAARRCLKP